MKDGRLVFTAPEKGTYTIAVYISPFNDIAQHWGGDDIRFVADRSLMNGTGSDRFAPDLG